MYCLISIKLISIVLFLLHRSLLSYFYYTYVYCLISIAQVGPIYCLIYIRQMSTIVFLLGLRRYLLHEDANEDARHISTAEKQAVNELGRLDISRSHLFTD